MLSLLSRKVLVVLLVFFGHSLCVQTAKAAEKIAPRPAWTSSKIKGAPTPPEPYKIVPAFPNIRFDNPSAIEQMPGGRIVVAEIGGRIFSFDKKSAEPKPELMADLSELLPEGAEHPGRMVLDLTFHPKFWRNRQLFVCYQYPGEKPHRRVSSFKVGKDHPPTIDLESEKVRITWPAGGHSGGCLEFGKDGMLYISVGDGSGPNPPDGLTTGQDVSDLLGSILRIDVDGAKASPNTDYVRYYDIPSDNPLLGFREARPEIWAYGLRNPWRFGIDPESGRLYAADNGWETWEMIHEILPGGNAGWPIMEGRAILRSEVKPGPTPIRPPIKDHPHTEANSVIGGPVYRGTKLPKLDGAFIYGDYITGTIWSVQTEGEIHEHQTLVDTDLRIVDFAQGRDGEVYVLDFDYTGKIYELLPNDKKDTSADFPRKLSETGVFASLNDLTPAPGVARYDVKVDRWLDGATAQRFVAIPNREEIRLGPHHEPTVYPEGTVFVKHLSFPRADGKTLPVETQILHYEEGRFHPYSYLWNETGDEAELVDAKGADRVFDLPAAHPQTKPAPRTWHINAQNECKLCHNAGSGFVLGFNELQLDVSDPLDPSQRQLVTLAGRDVLTAAPYWDNGPLPKFVDPKDESQNLDDRARSYLHANCSMCHHPGGNAIVSFYLRRELPFEKLNTNKGTGIGTFGMKDAKIIVPGDPYRSVLMYRMAKLGYARMPYIGSRAVDSFGVALIEDWIRAMPLEGGQKFSLENEAEAVESMDVIRKDSATRRESEHAVRMLLRSTEGSLALAGQMHRGNLSEQAHKMATSAGKLKAVKSDVRGLFETFVPESERRPTLGPNVQPETILDLKGVPDRGKLIFFSDSARCRNCHDQSDAGKSAGPTLFEIKKKYPNRSEMLQHILNPSLKVEEKFASYTVLTVSGAVYTGMLVKENEKEIVLKTAEKRLITIPRKDIEAIKKADKSLMPDQILSDLTAQEAADLLDFLLSLDAKP